LSVWSIRAVFIFYDLNDSGGTLRRVHFPIMFTASGTRGHDGNADENDNDFGGRRMRRNVDNENMGRKSPSNSAASAADDMAVEMSDSDTGGINSGGGASGVDSFIAAQANMAVNHRWNDVSFRNSTNIANYLTCGELSQYIDTHPSTQQHARLLTRQWVLNEALSGNSAWDLSPIRPTRLEDVPVLTHFQFKVLCTVISSWQSPGIDPVTHLRFNAQERCIAALLKLNRIITSVPTNDPAFDSLVATCRHMLPADFVDLASALLASQSIDMLFAMSYNQKQLNALRFMIQRATIQMLLSSFAQRALSNINIDVQMLPAVQNAVASALLDNPFYMGSVDEQVQALPNVIDAVALAVMNHPFLILNVGNAAKMLPSMFSAIVNAVRNHPNLIDFVPQDLDEAVRQRLR
jgi:hypothetical protein